MKTKHADTTLQVHEKNK